DVGAAAPDESRILFAQHPTVPARLLVVVDHVVGGRRARFESCHDPTSAADSLACRAAHWIERTIVVYPVHRQIWPEMASRMVSSSGSGFLSSRARAVIIIPGVQKPHCSPWHRTKPSCTGSSRPSISSPSTVRTLCPDAI